MTRSQPSCSPAHFHSRLTPKRKLPYPESVSLLCLDTANRHRHAVTNRRPLLTARHPRPDMVKVRGMIITTGSIASDLSIESTKSVNAWSTPLTVKIESGWRIISTKFMKSVNTTVGAIEIDCKYEGLQCGPWFRTP